MEFMNIIFCSLPTVAATRMLLGVDGSCLAVINRFRTMAPGSLSRGFSYDENRRGFFVEVIVRVHGSAVLSFPLKGVGTGARASRRKRKLNHGARGERSS